MELVNVQLGRLGRQAVAVSLRGPPLLDEAPRQVQLGIWRPRSSKYVLSPWGTLPVPPYRPRAQHQAPDRRQCFLSPIHRGYAKIISLQRDLKFANALHFTGRPWANIFDDELVLEFWRTATEVLLEEQPLARALGLGTSWSSLQDSIGERGERVSFIRTSSSGTPDLVSWCADLPVLRGQGKVLEYARLVKCRRAERNGSKYSECPDPRIVEALGAERLDLEELEDGLRRTTAEAARLTAEWQGGQNKVVK